MKVLFNSNWRFLKTELGVNADAVMSDDTKFENVDIPHDWLIYDTHNLYEDSIGWYIKDFEKPETEENGHVFLYFEGVYMDSEVFVNGTSVGVWKYGYTSFFFEITENLKEGTNRILLKVTYQSPNSRWYSGAGIFRNVYLITKPKSYIDIDGIYVHSEPVSGQGKDRNYRIKVKTEIVGLKNNQKRRISLFENFEDKKMVFSTEQELQSSADDYFTITVENVHLWGLNSPDLYSIKVELLEGGHVTDEENVVIGFKHATLSTDKGFFLNGEHIKIQGTCEHHDLGLFGACFVKEAAKRRLLLLQSYGVNAIRTSHNPPAPALLDLCDEMGILVMDEAFDMWEMPKTTFDYARFFKEWHETDVKNWIRRDRNHVSIFFWSIGNEIGDTHAGKRGLEITEDLRDHVREHDPLGNAAITLGSNYMPWENAQKCADALKIAGYNYAEKYYNAHHAEHPDWVIYGSETGSLVSSRGVYRFPLKESVMAEIDEQCSALGNSSTSWGAKDVESLIIEERDHDFSLGQFIWSGFDYIGEPTPYHTKNSYLGHVDTAGFPKDSFECMKAYWKESEPLCHVYPFWDWNEGQMIDVRVATSGKSAELFVNGRSLGKKQIDREHGTELIPTWSVPFEKGEIRAVAYDDKGKVIGEDYSVTPLDSAYPVISTGSFYGSPDSKKHIPSAEDQKAGICRLEHNWGDSEYLFITITMNDAKNREVPNAMDYVSVETSGDGVLVGMDNGDSTDYDSYQGHERKLFNGKLLAVFKKTGEGKTLNIIVNRLEDRVPVRRIKISTDETGRKGEYVTITPENNKMTFLATLCPANANQATVSWETVSTSGIPVKFVKVEQLFDNPYKAVVSAIGDGDFVLRCFATENGKVTVISQIEMTATGFGKAFTDPYDFVCAGLYTDKHGDIGSGNEKGIATDREGDSWVSFSLLDFGKIGSDLVTIWFFSLSNEPFEFELYDGKPENGKLLSKYVYHKPSIWNVYQEDSFKLPEILTGIHEISIVTHIKVHIKGFVFDRLNLAFRKTDCRCLSSVDGDSFERKEDSVVNIGNNVTLTFDEICPEGAKKIRIYGKTPLESCPVQLRFNNGTEEKTMLFEYPGNGTEECEFEVAGLTGAGTARFIFLPGAKFDFYAFEFLK